MSFKTEPEQILKTMAIDPLMFHLYKRSLEHKSNCYNQNNKQYHSKLYTTIRNNGGFDNWNIEVVENYVDCNSLDEARAKERYWCEELRADLNTNRPIISDDELKEYIKNYHKEYNKQYHQR